MDWTAIGMKALGYWWVIPAALWTTSRCQIVKRAGLPASLGILWSIPIIGWFFKVWFAYADWPNVKAPSRPKAKKATTKAKTKKASA